jgi:aminotransferase EvaB
MASNFRIPFIDLFTDSKRELLRGTLARIEETVTKSQFILGDAVSEFERDFAKLSGTTHAVAVNSGLDALILSLRAVGIGKGDEVITAPNSFIATAAAIALVGAKPVFADVGEDFNLDPSKLEAAMTAKTRAIMPVHLTGNPCRMEQIRDVADAFRVKIIEDAAQAVGAAYDDVPAGALGLMGAFSLHPLKNLHAWGDGGIITTNSQELADNLKLQRNHGLKNRDEVEFYSYNSRLDSIQAVVALQHLKLLDETTDQRRAHAHLYDERLGDLGEHIKIPMREKRVKHVFHVYQLRAKNRDALKAYLAEQGIETKVHYPIPIHWQKASAYLGYKKGDFPVCDRLAGEILSLPVRENLKDDEIDFICDAVRKFYRVAKAA